MLSVDRTQVLAYRIAAHDLHRQAADPASLAAFDLGVQDNHRDAAALALAARLRDPVPATQLAEDSRFVLAWTHRGAPHLHRATELDAVTATTVPLDEVDALARLAWDRRKVASATMPAAEAITATARAVHSTVDKPMTKGAVSTQVTTIVGEGLSLWCRNCRATHVHEQLLRLAALAGTARLVAGTAVATLAPVQGTAVRTEPDPAGTSRLVAQYLRLHEPATTPDVASFLGASTSAVRRVWSDELAEVRVDGRTAFLPADALDELANPERGNLVRLVPPSDPFLQARDRSLLVPASEHRKQIWKILGNPGAVLAGREIVGTWRSKSSGDRLTLTVTPLPGFAAVSRSAIDDEAQRIAVARGYSRLQLVT